MQPTNFQSYFENLKSRPKTKHRTRIQELFEPHLPIFNWTNDTFYSDMTALWVSLHRYMKSHTEYQLLELTRWAKGKNLHVRQFISALNNQLK